MNFLLGLLILCIVGIVGDTIVKVAKSRSGAPALRAQLDELSQQLQDQAAALADAQATIAGQAEELLELHERVDFAERMLTQVRDRSVLPRGDS